MPLTEHVNFKGAIQRSLRIQIPVLIRWRFRLEPGEVFKVNLRIDWDSEEFYGRMSKDGRLTIPRRIAAEFLEEEETFDDLCGHTMEVTLEPIIPRGIKPQQLTGIDARSG